MDEAQRTSRFLSYVLRHRPDAIGLALDAEGWAEIDALLRLAQAECPLTRDAVLAAVAGNDKQRFALSDDGLRIRARQGHSIAVDLHLTPRTPPARLYHGTATRFLDAIRRDGLLRRGRHHVHLSADADIATAVGARHGRPVVLVVHADAMHAAGHVFHRSENGVWLTEAVPVAFLELPAPR